MVLVSLCPGCRDASKRLYRCDTAGCGRDLTHQPVEYRPPDGAPADAVGLTPVAFTLACCRCDRRRKLAIRYPHVGRVIQTGCPHCGAVTRHRPTGPDRYLRYREVLAPPISDGGHVERRATATTETEPADQQHCPATDPADHHET